MPGFFVALDGSVFRPHRRCQALSTYCVSGPAAAAGGPDCGGERACASTDSVIPAPMVIVSWIGVPVSPPVSSVGSVLSRSLILGRNHAVGIATSMDVDVIAVAAPPLTNLVNQIVGVARGSCAKVSSECCSSDCDYHTEPSITCRLTNVLQLLKFQTGRIIRFRVQRRVNGAFRQH